MRPGPERHMYDQTMLCVQEIRDISYSERIQRIYVHYL